MSRTPTESRSPEDLCLLQRFKHLTEEVLPHLAAKHGWPLRFDHCFKRLCLDWAFSDVWYNHLPRPAERHLQGTPLRRTVACAEDLASGGERLLRDRNARSLRWRDKQAKPRRQSP